MGYDEFLHKINEAAIKLNSLDKKPIRIIGHLDADGITSTAILIKALERQDYGMSASLVMQLNNVFLEELAKEDYETIFFVDIGSGFLNQIEKILHRKNVFILDHHNYDGKAKNPTHINSKDYGIAYDDISAAGIVYLFCKALNRTNEDLAHLAFMGAIGDMQEKNGVVGLNRIILDDAIRSNKIGIENGLTIFNEHTKPLHKVLESSINPFIPGVTGSEKGAIDFLKELGIEILNGDDYRKLNELDDEEIKKLVTGITLKRIGSYEINEDIFGPVYLLKNESKESIIRDAKEFTSLLNACGRFNKPSLGLGMCLNSEVIRTEALNLLDDYRNEIINALNWFYKNKEVFEKEGFVIVNAGDNIRDSIAGVLAGIISKSNMYEDGRIIVVMARSLGNETKISARISGDKHDLDLRRLLQESVNKTGDYIAGGHKQACGALIPSDKEEVFIENITKLLSKIAA